MSLEPPEHLRVGHREREAAIARLQEAAADGRLSLDELEVRLEVAMQAKTYADLDPLLADLSPVPLSTELVPPGPRPGSAGYAREDPLRLDGAEQRTGVWTVPPFVRISHGARWAKLNFLQAVPAAPLIEIEIVGGAGWVLLVVPDGWAVDADRLATGWGSKSIKAAREPAAGCPLVVLHGSVGPGRVRVRPPKRRERRRLS